MERVVEKGKGHLKGKSHGSESHRKENVSTFTINIDLTIDSMTFDLMTFDL